MTAMTAPHHHDPEGDPMTHPQAIHDNSEPLDPDQPLLPGVCPRCGGFGLPVEHRACLTTPHARPLTGDELADALTRYAADPTSHVGQALAAVEDPDLAAAGLAEAARMLRDDPEETAL